MQWSVQRTCTCCAEIEFWNHKKSKHESLVSAAFLSVKNKEPYLHPGRLASSTLHAHKLQFSTGSLPLPFFQALLPLPIQLGEAEDRKGVVGVEMSSPGSTPWLRGDSDRMTQHQQQWQQHQQHDLDPSERVVASGSSGSQHLPPSAPLHRDHHGFSSMVRFGKRRSPRRWVSGQCAVV